METVADGQTRPLVVVKQQGAGRVAVVLSNTLWRWRVASPGWSGRLSAYDTFWAQLLDWLTPDQEGLQSRDRIEMTSDKPSHHQGDAISIQAEWIGKGAAPFDKLSATVTSPSGRTRVLDLQPAAWINPEGRRVNGFRGTTEADETGVHRIETRASWSGGETSAEMRVAVAASPEERRGEGPDGEFLHALAKQSGGAYFARGEGDNWLKTLPKAKHETERTLVTDIWNHPLIAVILLGSLCGEWWLRRRRGLA